MLVLAMRARQAAVATLASALLALGACGASPGRSHLSPRRWLIFDASKRSATIALVAAYDATAGGFNLNGANKGALLFTAPRGWRVTVRCMNNASVRRYACALARSPGSPVGAPPSARTSELAPGAQAAFSFPSGSLARYRLVATTEGHRPVGMWVTLLVTRSRTPSVRWVR
jgi:sulfocyanin SoxE-like protein